MPTQRKPPPAPWESRLVGEGEEAPESLLANPLNFRIHPRPQQEALSAVLDRVGYVQRVIVNRRTGHVIDGHLRIELALSRGQPTIPVAYVDLNEAEEREILFTFDPLGAMAATDREALTALAAMLDWGEDATRLSGLLESQRRAMDTLTSALGRTDGPTLADRFLVPPFTVLDARQGYWQERKAQWLRTGIESELGRSAAPGGGGGIYGDGGSPGGFAGQGQAGSGTSIFDPVLAELLLRWFSPPSGRVLDPFAGGSVRGIVAAILGRTYTGIDLMAAQVAANEEQWLRLGPHYPDAPAPAWLLGDAAQADEICYDHDGYDFVFTCPPYGDLERYSDDPADLSVMEWPQFQHAYREILSKAAGLLREDRFAAFVVGDLRDSRGLYRGLPSLTIEAAEAAGLRLYNEAILVTSIGSLPVRAANFFVKSRKLGKTHQNVLVFVKGDPRRATEACGEVAVATPEEILGEVGP